MRLSAYKKALDETITLSTRNEALYSYFEVQYPRREREQTYILQMARGDSKIFHSEFVELFNYYQNLRR